MATNLLQMTEDEFWSATPKKLQALFIVYKKVHGIEESEFDNIDSIMF